MTIFQKCVVIFFAALAVLAAGTQESRAADKKIKVKVPGIT